MSKHTPGPWRVVEIEVAKARIRAHAGPIEVDVAECYGGPSDARLIAAAPALLEALKEMVVAYSEDSHEVRKARAAIAAAEGRQ